MDKLKRRINGDRTVFADLDKAQQSQTAGASRSKSGAASQSQPQEPPNYSKEDVSDQEQYSKWNSLIQYGAQLYQDQWCQLL